MPEENINLKISLRKINDLSFFENKFVDHYPFKKQEITFSMSNKKNIITSLRNA